MKKKVLVFDLDDTLYKEVDFMKSAYRGISLWLERSYEIKGVYDYMLHCYEQRLNVFMCVNDKYGLDVSLENYLHKYRTHFPALSLSQTVESFLKAATEIGSIIGIITDGRGVTQSNKIKALGLNHYVSLENCIISEIFGYSKPSKEGFLYFQNKYMNANFYYIGDNVVKDFIAPNQLGWTTICLLDNGQNIHKQIPVEDEMKPQYEIENFDELYKFLKKDL